MNRLSGKVGVITGAAGGIGAAAARAFVAEGAVVGLLDRPGRALDALAAELGPAAVALPADVTGEASVAAAFAAWAGAHERADFVYVCAGQQLHDVDGRAGDVSLDTWERTIAVNLTGAFLTVKHALPALCAAPSGSLILCGSPTGLSMSGGGNTAYGASKAGMMALARIVAADYAAEGVRANIIVPGTTRTPLIEPLLADPQVHAALLAGAPIGRLGTPADLTGIAVFLAGDESRYATGATFAVDGGLTVR
ncbi:SDR family NAD(P)-dependent oxidoreductase [Dactylosporangium matsuzakiense]|uniref:Oxidoreductase n=1 Tax=Dactylosporangium matsuzakiense TaxID=53360 RepID=A0A9W6KUJ3_9ACTN|nr:SDR family oxidoreductase [Dactylosporangium matsuzakiense]UWZ42392.1 SDR family oxidoreductase [Dactylosporangium matsuzakiense]GLL07928.1 oxidoreductase [Dactylosporangium matsuzakiense]